jgi:hypothetical protein
MNEMKMLEKTGYKGLPVSATTPPMPHAVAPGSLVRQDGNSRVAHPATGKVFRLTEADSSDWSDSWPTYLAKELPVSEGIGSINGSTFCFWLGSADPASAEIERKITSFLKDHDVVAIRFVRALPIKVHPSIEAQFKVGEDSLPEGWTEAAPGGMATNPDPSTGGIIDRTIADGKWFVVFHRDGLETLEGFPTRQSAFEAFHNAIHRQAAARKMLAPQERAFLDEVGRLVGRMSSTGKCSKTMISCLTAVRGAKRW